jgi:hypothetical protein
MKKIKIILIIILLFSFSSVMKVGAATKTAVSCSLADVKAAINSAASGDTVIIPAGSCSWTTDAITVNKTNLTIEGAGAGNTIITLTGGGAGFIADSTANGLRVTGLEIRSGMGLYSRGIRDLRVDHCKFVSQSDVAIQTNGFVTGVFDHNTFVDTYGARLYGDNNNSETFPMDLGTSEALFFEDNTITMSSGSTKAHFVASNSGSRYVFRYNTFNYSASLWDIIDAHGYCEVQGRGSFTWEVYNNKFNLASNLNRIIHFRGGQGVVFNNNININASWPIVLDEYAKCNLPCVATCSSYPCKDQINNSYFWNNKRNCGSDLDNCTSGTTFTATNDCTDVIQKGRDYWDSAMPNYTPYTYPHPLVQAPPVTKPGSPSNFQIISK